MCSRRGGRVVVSECPLWSSNFCSPQVSRIISHCIYQDSTNPELRRSILLAGQIAWHPETPFYGASRLPTSENVLSKSLPITNGCRECVLTRRVLVAEKGCSRDCSSHPSTPPCNLGVGRRWLNPLLYQSSPVRPRELCFKI